jgi:hypothetical protein
LLAPLSDDLSSAADSILLSLSSGNEGASLAAGSLFLSLSKLGAAGILGSIFILDSLALGGFTVPKVDGVVGGYTPKLAALSALGNIDPGAEGKISVPCPATPVPIEGTTIAPLVGFTEFEGDAE